MRSRARASLLAAVLLIPAAAAAPEVVERIVAVVDGRPLLLSEVRLLGRLRGVDEETAREGLIDEVLMLREAARLPQAAVSAEEEQRAFESIRASGRPGEEANLRRLARRQAAILKYVEFRFRPRVRVEEAAVREAYARKYPAADPPLDTVVHELRRGLEDEELGRLIDVWVKELRRGAELRAPSPGTVPASR